MKYEDLYSKNKSGKMYWQHLNDIVKKGDKIKIGAKSITIANDLQWQNLMGHFERKGSIAAFKNLNNLNKIKVGANSYKLTQIWNNLDIHHIDFLSTRSIATPTRKTSKTRKPIPIAGQKNDVGIHLVNPSKSGDGGRSKNTPRHETLTAYMCAAVCHGLNVRNGSDVSQKQLEQYKKYVVSNVTLDEIYENLWEKWFDSSMKHAQAIKQKGYITRNQKFHLDDPKSSNTVKKVQEKAKQELRQAGIPFELNKWNTADIWAIDSKVDIENYFSGNIFDTRKLLQKAMADKQIVGLSLKDVVSERAFAKELNFNRREGHVKYKWVKINVLSANKLFTNNAVSLMLGQGSFPKAFIYSRNSKGGFNHGYGLSDNAASSSGDVSGQRADERISKFRKTPEYMRNKNSLVDFADKVERKDPKAISELSRMLSELGSPMSPNVIVQNIDIELKNQSKDPSRKTTPFKDFIRNKSAAIKVVYDIYKLGNPKNIEWIAHAMAIASASSDWSSPFIKLY